MPEPDVIARFSGEHEFLSNFHERPISAGGLIFPSGEHLFQWYKTLDREWREKIRTAPTPNDAKRFGRRAPLREGWDDQRLDYMRTTLLHKFQDPELRKKLLETGDAILVEGNTWNDNFWGVDIRVGKGPGKNWLGRLLMELREKVRSSEMQREVIVIEYRDTYEVSRDDVQWSDEEWEEALEAAESHDTEHDAWDAVRDDNFKLLTDSEVEDVRIRKEAQVVPIPSPRAGAGDRSERPDGESA